MRKLANNAGIRDLEIRTAGVMTVAGLLPSDESVQMLEEQEMDISSHRSRPLTPEIIRRVDLLLGMTPIHVQTALRMSEESKGKTFLLRDFAGTAEGKNSQVNDPMGCTLEVYKNCFKLIRKACEGLMKTEFFLELVPQVKRKAAAKKETRKPAKKATKLAKKAAKPAKKAPKPAKKKTVAPAKKTMAKKKKTIAPEKNTATKKTSVSKARKKSSPKKTTKKKSRKK